MNVSRSLLHNMWRILPSTLLEISKSLRNDNRISDNTFLGVQSWSPFVKRYLANLANFGGHFCRISAEI